MAHQPKTSGVRIGIGIVVGIIIAVVILPIVIGVACLGVCAVPAMVGTGGSSSSKQITPIPKVTQQADRLVEVPKGHSNSNVVESIDSDDDSDLAQRRESESRENEIEESEPVVTDSTPGAYPSSERLTEAKCLFLLAQQFEDMDFQTNTAVNNHEFTPKKTSSSLFETKLDSVVYSPVLHVFRRDGECKVGLVITCSFASEDPIHAQSIMVNIDGDLRTFRCSFDNHFVDCRTEYASNGLWVDAVSWKSDAEFVDSIDSSEVLYLTMMGSHGRESISIIGSALDQTKRLARMNIVLKQAIDEGIDVYAMLRGPRFLQSVQKLDDDRSEREEMLKRERLAQQQMEHERELEEVRQNVSVSISKIEHNKYTHKITIANRAKYNVYDIKIVVRIGETEKSLTLKILKKGATKSKRVTIDGDDEPKVFVESLDYDEWTF